MAKDVNIHIKAQGAEQTKQKLDGVGKSAEKLGQRVATGQNQAAGATKKTTQKLTGMGTTLGKLGTQVKAFLGAWLGLQAVMKLITMLIAKLERVTQLQGEIYDKSLSIGEIGQALEMQTGTKGKQEYWGEKALQLQKAGGLVSTEVASQMMVAMDIAFAKQGGIKDAGVQKIATELAPFVGANQMSPEAVGKLFQFAGTAGIAPTTEAYQKYFAQLQAGYTSSKSRDFGQFMTGLQKGGTAYMSKGGTLTEAISTFSGALSVTSNEALGSTLLEQTARLSGGGYAGPRKAIEQALGINWSDLSMDERVHALLRYVGGVPESKREQVLAEQGFAQELTTGISKMVTSEAMDTMAATRAAVGSATAEGAVDVGETFLKSMVGKAKAKAAGRELAGFKEASAYATWAERLKDARTELDDLTAAGKDYPLITDKPELQLRAIEKLVSDYKEFVGNLPADKREKEEFQLQNLKDSLAAFRSFPYSSYYSGKMVRTGLKYSRKLEALEESGDTTESGGTTVINNFNYHNDIIHKPIVVGDSNDVGSPNDLNIGPRFKD